jgi:hypothetical protein
MRCKQLEQQMAKKKIENLISEMHETFGDDQVSPQQEQLMQQLQLHMHNWGEPDPPDPTIAETVEMLLVEFEEDHPKAAAIVRQILETFRGL